MDSLPTNLTGLEAIQWLWDNECKGNFIAINEGYTHSMRIHIMDLQLYAHDWNDKSIYYPMGFCLNVILGKKDYNEAKWSIKDISKKIFTTFNNTEYEISGCTSCKCSVCQYETTVRKDKLGLPIVTEYEKDYDEEREYLSFKEENYIEVCALNKQITGGIRHEWCIAGQKIISINKE
jgi:hypothetical protein